MPTIVKKPPKPLQGFVLSKLTAKPSPRQRRAAGDVEAVVLLLARAVETFGKADAAYEWFTTPTKALRGQSPLDIAQTALGREKVLNELGVIDHGMFA